ncbi:MAG TPA: MEDS domain-containing protein [Polyangiales bacterium]|nr:MEDS domain-containing protein [Polyangiales bacterium]
MSQVISLVPPVRGHAQGAFAFAESSLIERPEPNSHCVQFYDSEEFLFSAVATFLAAGIEAGDRVIVVASAHHEAGFVAALGEHRAEAALRSGQLRFLDARGTLARFMIDGAPDPEKFREVIGAVLAEARAGGHEHVRVRAYGEMVDLLWRDGDASAALRLEELWNEESARHSFELLCAYAMGSFYREGDQERFLQVCGRHTHVLPTEGFLQLDGRARLKEIGVLQQRAQLLEAEIQQRRVVESKLRETLREQCRVEDALRVSVKREQEARERAEQSDQFKEMLVAMLGHELRNPLNTILMTARLLQMRDAPEESERRLSRLAASGLRMKRMIEQMLDLTRARLSGGIPVSCRDPRDIVALTLKAIEDLGAGYPAAHVELEAPSMCVIEVDGDRFQQVLVNLIGNALEYGDSEREVLISIEPQGSTVSVRVRNFGPVIAPEFLPYVFDPFRRAQGDRGRPGGLGIGLYICDRIVHAHGGSMRVSSDEESGTCFEACFPRTHG